MHRCNTLKEISTTLANQTVHMIELWEVSGATRNRIRVEEDERQRIEEAERRITEECALEIEFQEKLYIARKGSILSVLPRTVCDRKRLIVDFIT